MGNDGEELVLDGGLVFEPVDQRRLVLHEFGELGRSLFHVFADEGIGLAVRYRFKAFAHVLRQIELNVWMVLGQQVVGGIALDDADGLELPILDQLISAFEFSPTEANDIRTWAEDMAPAIAKGWLLVDGESSEAGR